MLSTLVLLAATALGDADPADLEAFEKEVRPILVKRCQGCHGPEKQKGDLRLDSRAAALAGGKAGPAVVPGKPDESVLVEAINYGDLVQMPPKSKLPQSEIDALTRWVERGAAWPAEAASDAPAAKKAFDLAERATHWSFRPIRRVDPPAVRDASWPLSPVDHFLLSALEAKGLKPAPEADRRTLLRRITFDLTGLPPTAGEIDAFLADASPDAWAKVVERLLASPHYGERWGRHWLDLVRFAETAGHEFDYDLPGAWRYRDYVVRAFNADLPYDRFLTEHVAGDLLPEPRRDPQTGLNESIVATGSYFLGEGVHSPVDVRDDEILRIDNQIDVIAKTFLGLTVSCARCHDHKFDAIRAKDYYALAGYLQSSRHQQAFLDPPERMGAKVDELAALKRAIAAKGLGLRVDRVAAYRDAAARAPSVAESTDLLFDDFETGRYEGWTATGAAFGDAPIRLPVPAYQGDVGAHGRGLVGSHNGRVMGSVTDRDALTGTLTSRAFPIERDFIHALIGGGSHAGKTCVNLLVDGAVVASLAGRDENLMRPRSFDVRLWKGRTARLQVVDDESGGWGNISLDHVVFSDHPAPTTGPERGLRAEADRLGLDPDRLVRWARARERQATPPGVVGGPESEVFADFDNGDFGGWTATGQAFGAAPSGVDAFRVGPEGPRPVPPGVAHSGLVSDRLMGVLRSPTFAIERGYVLVRAWGKHGRINVVIDGFEKIRDPIYGGLLKDVNSDAPAWIALDVSMWMGHRAYLECGDGATLDFNGANSRRMPGDGYLAIDEVRFAPTPQPPLPPPIPSLDALPAAIARWGSGRASADDARVVAFAASEGLLESDDAAIAPLLSRYRAIEATIPEPTLATAILDGTPEDEHVLIRGSAKSPGEVVPRRFLEAVAGPDQPPPASGSGRLELARRMLDPSCPMPARVMANRIWKGHFGVGLVKTPDDFGRMGEPPSHPELLDWMASEFRDRGWSVKAMHRLILLSRAYRMSSTPADASAEEADPTNRLLHRMNVRRLEAESVRDAMLAVSGRLDPTMGGPGVPPFLTPFMDGRGKPARSGPLDGDGRRSLYLNVRRNFLNPMLLAFDFPAPASTMGRRNVSNVPAQALTLLDDPFVLGQARLWAARLLAEPGRSRVDRVGDAYVAAFGRPPGDAERADALAFLESRPDPDGLDAWADLAHVLFNVKEFLFVP